MRLPDWIRAPAADLHSTRQILKGHRLHTVCEEARCPNRGRCFSKPTAAFMILGDVCSRDCAFCSVKSGSPAAPDPGEPERIAEAARDMGLRYVVVTSVSRDDLPDGGSAQFALSITALRKSLPDIKIEVLTPDFRGDVTALLTVLEAGPDVFNHNIETVKRLYPEIRPQADYRRSLKVLENAAALAPNIRTKSGIMVGLGETMTETIGLFSDLRESGCDCLTIGQYLRPSKKNPPVVEYIRPEVFDGLKQRALELGFAYVASAPLVRSSMNAEEIFSADCPADKLDGPA